METTTHTATHAKPGQYLTFVLKKQYYGVPIEAVREINRMSDITPVPKTPEYVVGVMNLRGKVIPVVCLRRKFGLEPVEAGRETCIIVIEGTDGQVGMIVDSVNEVVGLTASQVEPPPVLGNESNLAYVMGMGKTEQRVIVLVDIVAALAKETFHAAA